MTIRDEIQIQSAIADRAIAIIALCHVHARKIDVLMDIEYVHEICPLRLRELLESDDLDFAHDMLGIYKHFNRETRQLENGFIPRFAA